MKLPSALQTRWDLLAGREKRLVLAAGAVVGAALVWWIAIGPAWKTLQSAPANHQKLDAQVQQMKALAAQAQALQSQPKAGLDESLRALEASTTQRLGPGARLSVVGDRATITLRNVPAVALAQWLAQARINARALPSEARLVRSGVSGNTGGSTAGSLTSSASWDGTLVLSLPPR
jgi:general secretion pathway protein M